MPEKCQRCGEEGEDRRTLWMACLYDMSELGLPFTEFSVFGETLARIGTKRLGPLDLDLPEWDEPQRESLSHHPFFTLRVCKECRVSWMGAIAYWFGHAEVDKKMREPTGTGAFIRTLGGIREMTEEECAEFERAHGVAPIRARKENE